MNYIKGIHHIALKCCTEDEYERTVDFYSRILDMPIARIWPKGTMVDTGNGIIEIFNDGDVQLEKGTIRHFAFNVTDVDALVAVLAEAGYETFLGPKDIVIGSAIPFPARIAFVYGPLGEEIELFQEKV